MLRPIGPQTVSKEGASGKSSGPTSFIGKKPSVVRNPKIPQQWAGNRIEPARSEPMSKDVIPVAIAAAAPPEDPPGVREKSHGFTVSG